jgi:hypothetical protein
MLDKNVLLFIVIFEILVFLAVWSYFRKNSMKRRIALSYTGMGLAIVNFALLMISRFLG